MDVPRTGTACTHRHIYTAYHTTYMQHTHKNENIKKKGKHKILVVAEVTRQRTCGDSE